MKTFLIWLCLAGVAFSAPSVSSVTSVTDGASATISGSSFGAEVTATPLVFDDFDSNDSGRQNTDTIYSKNCSGYGAWDDYYDDSIPTYTNTNQRTGSTLSSLHHLICNDGNNNHALIKTTFATDNQTGFLLSFWLFVEWDSMEGIGNIKAFRINDGDGEDNPYTSLQVSQKNGNPMTYWEMFNFIGTDTATWPAEGDSTLNYNIVESTWNHYIIIFKAGTNGNADGTAIVWVNGQNLEDTDTMETFETADQYDRFTACYYCANYTAGNVYMQFDDVYIDTTPESVWIGNNSTWSTCTAREVQIQTARSDTEITITVNQGALTDTAWVYVMDANGNVNSSGYQVIFGATGTPAVNAKCLSGNAIKMTSGTSIRCN